jgi:hypothetical protein
MGSPLGALVVLGSVITIQPGVAHSLRDRDFH